MPKNRQSTTTKVRREVPPMPSVQTLLRRIRRLEATLAAERERQAQRVANVRRAADRKLARMMQEIAALRHHEARAEALERLLAEREQPAPKETAHGQDPSLPG